MKSNRMKWDDWIYFAVLWVAFTFVSAKGPPRLEGEVERRHLARWGETIRLPCPVISDPSPILEWTKDDESINAGWDRFKVITRGLRIKDLAEEDKGVYICKATNGFGTLELKLWLYVYPDSNETSVTPINFEEHFPPVDETLDGELEPPRFTKPDQMRRQSILKPAGSTVRLRCKAQGKPRPNIMWYKEGKIIPDMVGGSNDPTRHERWTLVLQDATEHDNGAYTCKVYNRAGSINFTYNLEVVAYLPKPQILDDHPQNTTVMEGEMTYFQCRIDSEMQPKIHWLKRIDNPYSLHKNATITVNNEHFVVINTSGSVMMDTDGTYLNKLTIRSTSLHDAGMYICWAANTMGYSFKSAFLTVLPDPYKAGKREVDNSLLNPPSLLLIIGLPALVVVIVIGVTIYCLQRRRNKPSKKPPVRQTRSPAPGPYPPQPQEKFYEHQYAALAGQPPPQMPPGGYLNHPNHQSQEYIVKNYGDISRSDASSSVPKSVTPNPPVSMGPPTLQHTHYHYHPSC